MEKEKKEIWKLIELLNEYEMDVVKQSYMYPVYSRDEENKKILNLYIGFNTEEELKYKWLLSYIVSLDYWFIERLVENDCLDLDKLEKKVLKENLIRKFDEWLLMLLSISDTPIEDLISYLK